MTDTLQTLFAAAWHSVVIYLFLIIGLNCVGRPLMAQFTLLEYLVIALLGSAVETGLYAGSASLPAGLVAAAALLASNRVLNLLLIRSSRVRRLLVGTPIVLVHDGQIIPSHLRRAGMTERDVRAAIRGRGYDSLDDVRLAVLEVNGLVGVVPYSGDTPR